MAVKEVGVEVFQDYLRWAEVVVDVEDKKLLDIAKRFYYEELDPDWEVIRENEVWRSRKTGKEVDRFPVDTAFLDELRKDLLFQVQTGNVETVCRMLADGVDWRHGGKEQSALHLAAKTGNLGMVQALLSFDETLLKATDGSGKKAIDYVDSHDPIYKYLSERSKRRR